MADTTNANLTPDDSIIRKSVLQYYDSKLKDWVNIQVSNAIDGGFKDIKYADSTLYFFDETAPVSADDYAAKAVKSISLPEEQLLDQAKTVFAENFAWSETSYPSSTNPNLDGKPVLVLAVKGEGSDVAYSFVSLEKLIDIYTGGATASTTTNVSADNKITVDVKVSAETGNTIATKDDGLYVPDVTVATGSANGTIAVNGTDVAVKGYSDLAAAVGTNTDAIAVLNGGETTEGSVAKAIKDYKDSIVYTNNDDIDALFATV